MTTAAQQAKTALAILGNPKRLNLPPNWVFGEFGIRASINDNTQATAVDFTDWSTVFPSPKIRQHYPGTDSPSAAVLITGLKAEVAVHGESGDIGAVLDALRTMYFEWTHAGATHRIDLYHHFSGFEQNVVANDTTASTITLAAAIRQVPMQPLPIDKGYLLVDIEQDTWVLQGLGNIDLDAAMEVEFRFEGVVFPNLFIPAFDSELDEGNCSIKGMSEPAVVELVKSRLARSIAMGTAMATRQGS